MLDRVVMDVIHVTLEVTIVADQVLPIAPLSDAPFAFRSAAFAASLALR